MKFACTLIAVKDIQASRDFYEKVLGQKVTLDLGANICFENRFAIQHDFAGLIGEDGIKTAYQCNDHELVFEEDDFDAFQGRLQQARGIIYLHKAKEYPWGQRVIRFYDPDFHIIEVGESMGSVFKKFYDKGMTVDEVAERTWHPVEFVRQYIT
ncbi:MAG: VOC family protein [Oscillospiraceae bacterium]|nr:VOC family protein [Oscillospiraceae bacterium]